MISATLKGSACRPLATSIASYDGGRSVQACSSASRYCKRASFWWTWVFCKIGVPIIFSQVSKCIYAPVVLSNLCQISIKGIPSNRRTIISYETRRHFRIAGISNGSGFRSLDIYCREDFSRMESTARLGQQYCPVTIVGVFTRTHYPFFGPRCTRIRYGRPWRWSCWWRGGGWRRAFWKRRHWL